MRLVASLLAAASISVAGAAIAKYALISTSDRYSEAETVVLVEITDARDGPVPWPYGLQKGALPGRLLKLRVLRTWKGSLHPEDVTFGWTQSPKIEDAYPRTEVGTQIIVFYPKDSSHEIRACNAAPPHRLNEVSQELDAIVRAALAQTSIPPFVAKLIAHYKSVPPETSPGSIWRYIYKGEPVYYVRHLGVATYAAFFMTQREI